jgi:serine/threonine protein kinase/tetratricopeptide (TPR) repeat protein
LIGKRLGHYLILHELGSGGMGVVYAAQDTRLDRRVALKLPRVEKIGALDHLALFQREARAAAALNHPNIVHLYSVEESDGLIFITMELVPGRTLRELLRDDAPFPLPRTLAFTFQMAEGLACAHAAGVLHRDLKPGNVMVTADDRVKILDFGVAKLSRPLSPFDAEAATRAGDAATTGVVVGTAGYMSPEQALGRTLDVRTDLFALGVMLFEMATGSAPFQGVTPAAVVHDVLNRRPPSALTLNPALPRSLAEVIDIALEKDRERRYASASALLRDLRRVDVSIGRSATPAAPSTDARMPTSVVVLPFLDMSPEKDQEYFCHGITEEIISTLTRVPGLRVISRTSAFAFQGKDADVTEIGRRLRVGTALEGSVRKAGNRVRVTAQLVSAEDGYQLWSKRFDRDLSDVFAIQDEIARIIVDELRMGLARAPQRPRAAFDVVAHEAYLRGMYAQNQWRDDSMRRAIADFREAIAQDSGFAPAYAALAEGYMWLYSGLGILPARESVPHARWAVENALALDPTLADAHKAGALIAMNHDWDRREAEEALARALHFGPGSAKTHLWNAWRLALLERRHDDALIELEEAERLDPLDLQLKTQIGYVHSFHHDLDRAIAQFERVLALEPNFGFAHYALGDAFTQRGQYDRAFAEFEKAIELGGRSVNHIGVLGYAYGRSGNRDRANEHLHELAARAAQGHVSPMWMALIHLGLSDLDSLFDWLNRAVDERDGSLILITAAVEFDPVRDDPRFRSLLERMGLGDLAATPVRAGDA